MIIRISMKLEYVYVYNGNIVVAKDHTFFLSMQFGRCASRIKKYITLNKYFDKSQQGKRERKSDSPGIPWMYYGYTSNCRPNFPLNVSGDYIGSLLYVSCVRRRDLSMELCKPLGKTDTRFTLVCRCRARLAKTIL